MDFSYEDIALNRKRVAEHVERFSSQHDQGGWLWNANQPDHGTRNAIYGLTVGQYAESCETQGCIAGWTCVLTLNPALKVNEALQEVGYDGFPEYAAAALGLSSQTAHHLFYGCSNESARKLIRKLADNPEMR